jgi:hypothetical protein
VLRVQLCVSGDGSSTSIAAAGHGKEPAAARVTNAAVRGSLRAFELACDASPEFPIVQSRGIT